MTDYDDPGRGQIIYVADEVAKGNPDPDEVKRLLEYFCKLEKSKLPIPRELLRFLAECFTRLLSDDAPSMDKAMGLSERVARVALV